MSLSDEALAARAAARTNLPGKLITLEATEWEEDLSQSTTVADRLEMMWELALSAWSLTGQPIPDYDRGQMPARLIRPGLS